MSCSPPWYVCTFLFDVPGVAIRCDRWHALEIAEQFTPAFCNIIIWLLRRISLFIIRCWCTNSRLACRLVLSPFRSRSAQTHLVHLLTLALLINQFNSNSALERVIESSVWAYAASRLLKPSIKAQRSRIKDRWFDPVALLRNKRWALYALAWGINLVNWRTHT